MKNKDVIVILLALIAIIGLMWSGRAIQKPAAGSSATVSGTKTQLSVSEKLYDFGIISMKNGKVEKVFNIANSSENDLTIESVSTSCMCTAAYLGTANGEKGPFGMPGHAGLTRVNEVVKAGETRTMRVVYDPNAHGPAGVGSIRRSVYVSDASGAVLELEIKAIVKP